MTSLSVSFPKLAQRFGNAELPLELRFTAGRLRLNLMPSHNQSIAFNVSPFTHSKDQSDGDGVPDGADAGPTAEEILFPRAGAPHYALIDIGEGRISALNGKGEAAGSDAAPVAFFWSKGTRKNLPGRKPQPRAVNDSGAIVGSAEFAVPGVSGTYNRRAAHWATADSEPADLGSLGKITTTGHTEQDNAKKRDEWGTSEAVAINNAGMIVGESSHRVHGTHAPGVIEYDGGPSRKAVRFKVGGKPTLVGTGKKDDTQITNYVIALSEGGVAVGLTYDYHSSPDYTGAALWDNGTFSKDLGEDFTPTGVTQAPSDDTKYKYYVTGTTSNLDDPAPSPNGDGTTVADTGTRLMLKSKDSGDFITKKLPTAGAIGITTDGLAYTGKHDWRNGKDEDLSAAFSVPDGSTFNGVNVQTPNGILAGSITITGGSGGTGGTGGGGSGAAAQAQAAAETTDGGIYMRIGLTPEMVTANTNFDGQKLKDGFAQSDAEDTSLQAAKGPNQGKIVTTDLYEGFVGLRPGVLPYTETSGAVVKIKKLDKQDSVTDAKQPGHVRLYCVWGETDADVSPIELYNPDTLVANDLGPVLYTTKPNVPVRFYLEGIKPGKITLEFSYQKGSVSFKHEHEFLVSVKKSRAGWLEEITDQIKLETDNAVDMKTYNKTDSFNNQRAKIQQVYRFYEGLHRRTPNVQRWGGLAKRAGCPVYAGLSDAQWGKEGSILLILTPITIPAGATLEQILEFFQNVLIHGGHNIFNDLAWQCRAYERGGYHALKHVKDNGLDGGAIKELKLDSWLQIAKGDAESNTELINDGTEKLAKREQEFIVQPAWDRINTLPITTVSTLFSWLAKNPIPGQISFSASQPGKNITIYGERWPWIKNDILPPWGGMAEPARQTLVNNPLIQAAAPYAWLGIKQ